MNRENKPITDEQLNKVKQDREYIEVLIGPGRKLQALKGDGNGIYSIEEFDPITKNRRVVAVGVDKLYAIEFAAIHNAFPSVIERMEYAEKDLAELAESNRLTEAQLNNASKNAKYYADKCVELESQLYKLHELIEDWKDNGEFDWSHPREAAIVNYLTEVSNA